MRDRRRDLSPFDAMACEDTVCTADFSPYLSLQLLFAVLDKRLPRSGRESHRSCDLGLRAWQARGAQSLESLSPRWPQRRLHSEMSAACSWVARQGARLGALAFCPYTLLVEHDFRSGRHFQLKPAKSHWENYNTDLFTAGRCGRRLLASFVFCGADQYQVPV